MQEADRVESWLPDGSYFSIGNGPQEGFLRVDVHETNLDQLQIATLAY